MRDGVNVTSSLIEIEVPVRGCFFKLGVLKTFAIFTGKHLCCNTIKRAPNTGLFL